MTDAVFAQFNDDAVAQHNAQMERVERARAAVARRTNAKAAATGTSPDAAAPLPDHSHPLQEARAGDELSAPDRAGFHESAELSKSCHESSWGTSPTGGARDDS